MDVGETVVCWNQVEQLFLFLIFDWLLHCLITVYSDTCTLILFPLEISLKCEEVNDNYY